MRHITTATGKRKENERTVSCLILPCAWLCRGRHVLMINYRGRTNVNRPHNRFRVWLLGAAIAAALSAAAQESTQPYKPVVGQPGKDAVWVPTSNAMVEKMLDIAKVTPADFVMDLGSGDGRTIIAAAKRGAHALGVEYNGDLVEFSKRAAAQAGVADKASFVQGDMYAADISKATVLALFLLPSNLEKLAPKFLDLPPGSRIVANTFWIHEWAPDETQTLEKDCDSWCTALLVIIPAKVEGTWRLPQGELTLTQKYQMVSGTLTSGNAPPVDVKGRLRGDQITMTVGDADYVGRVNGDSMSGAIKGNSRSGSWTATRTQ
jgi:precorrin-6B methylase 2